MTDITTTPEQVEAVAMAMSRVDWCGAKFKGEFCLCDDPRLDDDVRSPECFCRLQAPAAINAMRPFIRAEALEEAAKLADTKADEWATVWRNRMKADQHMEGKSDGAYDIAAAIRALISKETA